MTKREEIMSKARELGESIKESEEYRQLLEAQMELDNDAETQEMLKEFDRKRNEVQMKQMLGEDVSEDIKVLEDMERRIMERESMARYAVAEEKFKGLIEEANKEIVRALEEEPAEDS